MAGTRRGAAAVLVALALLGAGCTGDDGAAGPGTTTGATGSTVVGGCPEGPGTPTWVHDRYDLASLLDAGHDGGGVRVALLSAGESADESAVLAGAACADSDAVLLQEAADGTELPPAGDRATLDAQAVLAAAPGLDELLVLTVDPGSDQALVDALATVAAGAFGRIDVLVAPPSRCLDDWDVTALEAAEGVLARLADQGVWVVAGTGDAGSTPCAAPVGAGACAAPGAEAAATTGYPASSAHVLAVGGTMVITADQLDAPPTPEEVALGPDGILGTADDGTGPPVTVASGGSSGAGDAGDAETGGEETGGEEGVGGGGGGVGDAVTGGGRADGDGATSDGEGDGDEGAGGDEDGGGDAASDAGDEPERPADVVWSDRWLPGAAGCAAGGGGEAGAGPGIAAPDWQASGLRQLPDVSALAGVPGVVAVGRDGRPVSATGTGVAAALTAGGLASVRSALRSAGTDLDGPLAEVVWLVAGDQAVRGDEAGAPIVDDVDTGSNDLLDVGCCPAGAGYDLASGWGVLRFGALALALSQADGLRPWPAEASPSAGTAPPAADDGDVKDGAGGGTD